MGELLVILAVAMMLVGPSDLPKVARWIAKAFKSIRVAVEQFSSSLNLDEDIKEIKETGQMLRETVHDINPLAELTDEIKETKRETKEAFNVLGDLNRNVFDMNANPSKTPEKTGGVTQDTGEV
jgi:sec-independent protein translocase protein TatB